MNGLDDLRNSVIPVKRDQGAALTLGQVADVRLGGPLAKRGDAGVNGAPAVILSIQKQPGASTPDLTRQIEQELERMQATLPKGVKIHSGIFRQSTFIENSIRNIEVALRDGAIFSMVLSLLKMETAMPRNLLLVHRVACRMQLRNLV